MTVTRVLTLGDVARHYGCPVWAVRRLYERGLLPEPARVGVYRVAAEADLPAIGAALADAGYLTARPAPEAGPL